MKRLARNAWGAAILFFACGVGMFVWWHLFAKPFTSALPESTLTKIQALSDIERLRGLALMLARDRARIDNDVNKIISAAIDLIATICVIAAGFGAFVAVRARKGHREESITKEARDA